MAKNGQAKVLSTEEFRRVLTAIESHRHPEKNALIMQLSFKLGLRVQEIALLRIREIAKVGPEFPTGFELKDVLVLPQGFTKGARATQRHKTKAVRKSVRFTLVEFDRVVADIIAKTKADIDIEISDYYPPIKKTGGKTRELPLADIELRKALIRYLLVRQATTPLLRPNDPLLLNQKGNAYTPNTLQEHMSLMLRSWSGVDRASSHSGRRTLATNLLHRQKEHLKTVQQILGHKDASTTTIYHEVPETEIKAVLTRSGEILS